MEVHEDCEYDYLEIRDGINSSAPLLPEGRGRRYCGEEIPPTTTSSGNALHVLFSSDQLESHKGFAFTYIISQQDAVCGGNVTGYIGALTSPNYPGFYGNEYTCSWQVRVDEGFGIELHVRTFELQPQVQGGECEDYLEVVEANGVSHGRFCGLHHFNELRIPANHVIVNFVSNGNSNDYRGFRLVYQRVVL